MKGMRDRSYCAGGRWTAVLAGGVLAGLAGVLAAATQDQKPVSFTRDIQPIFKASCVKCHSPNNPRHQPASGFRLDSEADAMKGGKAGHDIVPGNADESLLYKLLKGPVTVDGDEIDAMPKAMRNQKWKTLPQKQIDLIKAWIDQGAKWN